MTESEKQSLYEAIRINAPEWYERTVKRLGQKKAVVSSCLYIAGHNDEDYQDEINRTYNSAKGLFNETETILWAHSTRRQKLILRYGACLCV